MSRKSVAWLMGNSVSELNNTYIFTVKMTIWFLTFAHKGEGKSVPLQAWSGPEGSRKLRFPDYVTMQRQISPVTGLEWPRGFQEVKFPRFHDNGTAWC